MSEFLQLLLTVSLVGSLLALVLLALRPLLARQISRRAVYYLWLIVLLRLCLPFGVSADVLPPSWFAAEAAPAVTAEPPTVPARDGTLTAVADAPSTPGAAPTADPFPWAALLSAVWLAGVLLVLGRCLWQYWHFCRLLRRIAQPPDEVALTAFRRFPESDRLPLLCCGSVTTPLLIGLFRPLVILPAGLGSKELDDVLRHELTHYRRRDLCYKWFAVLVTALHWFNPLMVVVRRMLDRDCELACDEAVAATLTEEQRQHYGETLLTLATATPLPGLAAATLSESGERLRERLTALSARPKTGVRATLLSLLLALCLCGCAAVNGVGISGDATGGEGAGPQQDIFTEGEYNVYENSGLQLVIPGEYAAELEVEADETDGALEFTVYEKQSYDESMQALGQPLGKLITIQRLDRSGYEDYLSYADAADNAICFARDDVYYYLWYTPSDVQFYRADTNNPIANDPAGWARWQVLDSMALKLPADFITRNGLTPYASLSEKADSGQNRQA